MQLPVLRIIKPSEYLYSILLLAFKIIPDIIDDDGLGQVPAQLGQVLDVDPIHILTAVPVESMMEYLWLVSLDEGGGQLLNMIEYKISVVLECRREDDDLKYLGHLMQESDAPRPDPELLLLGLEVHEGLVEV